MYELWYLSYILRGSTDNILSKNPNILPSTIRGEVVLPYLGMVEWFRGNDPRFGDFQSHWFPIL